MAQHKGLFPLFPTLEIKTLTQKDGGKIKTGFANWIKHKKNKRREFSWFKHTKKRENMSEKTLERRVY